MYCAHFLIRGQSPGRRFGATALPVPRPPAGSLQLPRPSAPGFGGYCLILLPHPYQLKGWCDKTQSVKWIDEVWAPYCRAMAVAGDTRFLNHFQGSGSLVG